MFDVDLRLLVTWWMLIWYECWWVCLFMVLLGLITVRFCVVLFAFVCWRLVIFDWLDVAYNVWLLVLFSG